eukprot:5872229-Pyramimonas_sp.AAC.1
MPAMVYQRLIFYSSVVNIIILGASDVSNRPEDEHEVVEARQGADADLVTIEADLNLITADANMEAYSDRHIHVIPGR